MTIFEDGSVYPSSELLAFRAMKMCGDCPIGTLDCAGSTGGLVPFAVNRGEIVTVAPESVFDFPYTHRATEQRLSVHCAYGHMGGFTLQFRGRIHRVLEDGAEALRHFRKVHPDHQQQHTAIARFVIEKIDYNGHFPEAGTVNVGMFSDERLADERVQFPEACRDFNSRPTTALGPNRARLHQRTATSSAGEPLTRGFLRHDYRR